MRRSFIVQRRSILVMDEVNLHLVLLGVWCPTRLNKTSATKVSLEARAPTAATNLSILNSPICTSTVNGLVVLHHASLIFLCGLGSSQCVCISLFPFPFRPWELSLFPLGPRSFLASIWTLVLRNQRSMPFDSSLPMLEDLHPPAARNIVH